MADLQAQAPASTLTVIWSMVLALGAAEWPDVLERYGIEAVLWERSKPLAALVSESSEWRVVHSSPDWLVAVLV
jgi:hypothetical protein